MSVESTRKVMQGYWSGHADASAMADDVVFTMMATGEETRGPEAVFQAKAENKNQIVADGQAVWEGDVVGKHIGEFAGIPATGKDFRVPLCVVYDLENDQVKRARIYFEIPVLLQQLGVQMGPG